MMLKVTDDETGALVEIESKTLDTLDRSFETDHYFFRFADGSLWGKSNREWVREFLNNGSYVSVHELASDEKFFSVPTEITYPIAGAFVGFLMERPGKERFLTRSTHRTNPCSVKSKNCWARKPRKHLFNMC